MKKIKPHGYKGDCLPDSNYKNKGLYCEYAHCIETEPPIENPICPIFGRVCPDPEGVKKVAKCENKINRQEDGRFSLIKKAREKHKKLLKQSLPKF